MTRHMAAPHRDNNNINTFYMLTHHTHILQISTHSFFPTSKNAFNMDHAFLVMAWHLAHILHELPLLTFVAKQSNQTWVLNTQNMQLERWVSSYKHSLLCYRMTVWFPTLELDGSQPPLTPSRGDLMSPSGFHGHLCSHMHMHTHTQICPNIYPICK